MATLKTTLRFARSRGGDGGPPCGLGSSPISPPFSALGPRALSPAPLSHARRDRAPLPASRNPRHARTARLREEEHRAGRGAVGICITRAHAKTRTALLAYSPHPPRRSAATDSTPATEDGIVLCGSFSDPDVHCADEKDDSVGAYTQALLWYLERGRSIRPQCDRHLERVVGPRTITASSTPRSKPAGRERCSRAPPS